MSKLLRDEKEVRLNDLMRTCLMAVEQYKLAADVISPAAQADRFQQIADRRADLCRRIEQFIRSCGHLPDTPDPDHQTVVNLAERAKAIISRDERRAMANDVARLENDMRRSMDAVMRQTWPPDRHDELLRIEKELLEGRRAIDELLDLQ